MFLYQIVSLLLDVAAGLLVGGCLMRLYMQYQKIPFGNPVGRFVFALTNWIVLPLRKVLPPFRRIDTASLVAAYLLEVVQYAIRWLFVMDSVSPALLPLVALLGMVLFVLGALTWLLILYAVMSWVRADSPVIDVIDRICAPMLRPFRRIIPLVGGVDLSPLALLLVLFVLKAVVGQAAVLLGPGRMLLA